MVHKQGIVRSITCGVHWRVKFMISLELKTIWREGSIQDTVFVFFLPKPTCSEHVCWMWCMSASCRKTFSVPSNTVGKSLILTVIHLTKILEPWITVNWDHCTAFHHTKWSKSGVSKLFVTEGHTHYCGLACHHAKWSWVSKLFMTKDHACNCELVRGLLVEK